MALLLFEALRAKSPGLRLTSVVATVLLAIAGIGGWLPLPLALVLASGAVCAAAKSTLGWAGALVPVLAIQLSAVKALALFAASPFDAPALPLCVGPLTLIALSCIAGIAQLLRAIVAAIGTCFLAHAMVLGADWSPYIQQLLSAVPAAALAASFPDKHTGHRRLAAFAAGVTLITVASYATSWPVPFSAVGVLPPERARTFEGDDYRGTAKILRFAGVPVAEWKTVDDIPPRSLVVLPASGVPSRSEESWAELMSVGTDRRLTFLVAAEHTNLFGISRRINRSARGLAVNWDTTVPPRNRDATRPMGSVGLPPFPAPAYLNRGASLRLTSPFAKPLVWGTGWFADSPATRVSGSQGDYRLQRSERRGEILLAAVSSGWPRFVVVGDSSFLIDRFLIANPRAIPWLIDAGSLFPAAVSDAAILGFSLTMWLVAQLGVRRAALLAAIPLAVELTASAWMRFQPSTSWSAQDLAQSVFDPRGFSTQIADWIALEEGPPPLLVRHREGLAWEPRSERGLRVHFGIVAPGNRASRTLGVEVSSCHRLGAVELDEGVVIQNGQVCTVPDSVRVHLGTRAEALAFSIDASSGTDLVVLDEGFLSNASRDTGNLEWLMRTTRQLRGEIPIEN
ncbi:MAG: hypothetical protein FJ033_16130 [Chloroflexi bacterium]|nr:hypothetical protein [Chloroflexota bacterium]